MISTKNFLQSDLKDTLKHKRLNSTTSGLKRLSETRN